MNAADDLDPYLTTREAAKLLRVSSESVIRWILHDRLPAVRLPGGHYRVRRSDVLARLKAVGERVQPVKTGKAAPMNPYTREVLRKAGLLRFVPGEG
jgi:excisionase family DNA binding protein